MKTLILACVMAFSFSPFFSNTPTAEVEILISPNPTYVGEGFNVTWTPEDLPMIAYRIFTRKGEVVAEEQFDSQTHWIEVPGLEEPGLYYLQLIDVEKRRHTTSFFVK